MTNQRYVASESSCTPGSHKEFFPGGFRDAQAEGVYSAALPATPDLTPKHRTPVIFGAFALLLAAIAALFAFVPSLRALIPARATPPSKSDAEAVVNVMCHMSIIDRKVDAHEIRVIARLGYEMTGHHIAPEEIVKLIKNTKRDMTPLECRALGKGLSLANRRLCYSAALKIATRHRGLIRPEVQFLRSLASGLRLSGRDVNKCVASAQTPTPDTAVVSPYDQVIPAQ
ncbi:hypothetical protein OU789_10695 [Halocynthiibacter sp. C4]|uniref:hypothetical protein n=1 Tax=Halocynthiibacter sp. C4 TaxID=2992758 RepID=UPI00237BB7F1|nr:hypothetical protein [Halocynthiibacter sp. C4]MDE0590395.1 hypothetical protein [Halocynthiibacter sp. C4]